MPEQIKDARSFSRCGTAWFRGSAHSLEPFPEPSLLGIAYPCVLKPLSLSASQGVVRCNNREEFLAGARG